jgi:hypothetical protein
MRALVLTPICLALLFAARAAEAHIQLDSPVPRYVFNNNGIEVAPCGSGTATPTPANPPVTGGSSLVVMWHETINHDGHYRIGLSANQSDFTTPASLAVPAAPLPSWDLADGIPDTSTGNGTFMKTITVPDIDCPHCVLQLVQIASLSSDGSNSGGYYTNYYECADLAITSSAGGGAGSGGTSGTGAAGSSGGGGGGGCSVGAGAPTGRAALVLVALVLRARRRRR